MIIEFDSKACLFVEDSIDSMIDHFVDISSEILTRSDSLRFFLNSDDRRDTINDFVKAQHSINVIFFVLYEHDRKRS